MFECGGTDLRVVAVCNFCMHDIVWAWHSRPGPAFPTSPLASENRVIRTCMVSTKQLDYWHSLHQMFAPLPKQCCYHTPELIDWMAKAFSLSQIKKRIFLWDLTCNQQTASFSFDVGASFCNHHKTQVAVPPTDLLGMAYYGFLHPFYSHVLLVCLSPVVCWQYCCNHDDVELMMWNWFNSV